MWAPKLNLDILEFDMDEEIDFIAISPMLSNDESPTTCKCKACGKKVMIKSFRAGAFCSLKCFENNS
jgi:hypothetical protein